MSNKWRKLFKTTKKPKHKRKINISNIKNSYIRSLLVCNRVN